MKVLFISLTACLAFFTMLVICGAPLHSNMDAFAAGCSFSDIKWYQTANGQMALQITYTPPAQFAFVPTVAHTDGSDNFDLKVGSRGITTIASNPPDSSKTTFSVPASAFKNGAQNYMIMPGKGLTSCTGSGTPFPAEPPPSQPNNPPSSSSSSPPPACGNSGSTGFQNDVKSEIPQSTQPGRTIQLTFQTCDPAPKGSDYSLTITGPDGKPVASSSSASCNKNQCTISATVPDNAQGGAYTVTLKGPGSASVSGTSTINTQGCAPGFFHPAPSATAPNVNTAACTRLSDGASYDPSLDPKGSCPTNGNLSTPDPSCLAKAYPPPPPDPCLSVARPKECEAAKADGHVDAYNDDICFSVYSLEDAQFTQNGQLLYPEYKDANGTPRYNTIDCKAKRGKATCDKKRDQGFVYTYVLGGDPEQSCYDFTGVIKVLMDYAMLIAAIICGFMFLRGGIGYTVSKGNPAALMEARDQILHATIGLVIIMLAFVIVQFLQGSLGFLGVNLVGPFGSVFGG